MPALVAPQPLLPPFQLAESNMKRLLSPPTILCSKRESSVNPLARLRSPSLPPESCLRPQSPSIKSPCNLTPRRRPKAPSHTLRRRRQLSRVDYRAERPSLHAFDKLPWITSLEVPPDHDHPEDIADLSLIPDPALPPHRLRAAGSGPVRRRKASPRSSPMASSSIDAHLDDYSLYSNLFPRETSSRPSTPISSPLDPARIAFQRLMPVLDGDPPPPSFGYITSPIEL